LTSRDDPRAPGAAASGQAGPSGHSAEHPVAKLLIDLGPLVAFFIAYARSGIYWATGVLMAATVIALIASRMLFGRFAVAPMVTAVLVVVFGGLTFWLEDPRFIMLKPTIINLGFAAVLGFGLLTGRPLLKLVMGEALQLTDEGWHKLTLRWIYFFVTLAILNEIVWRNFAESTWVAFKAWGILPLTLLFAIAQIGLIRRYEARHP
jgi:intracellular septation protein